MKSSSVLKQLAAVFLCAAAVYAGFYSCIQHRRAAQGPWRVTFTSQSGAPAITIQQPALGIQDVRVVFAGELAHTNPPQTMEFSEARPVPFDVPFGKCIFLDPLFLPGTVTFDLFSHEIQLMPRVLTIDRAERPWRPGETIKIGKSAPPPP